MTGPLRQIDRATRPSVRFAERGKGYDVGYVDETEPRWQAVRILDHGEPLRGRWGGWILIDATTGETIFGAGNSTRLGPELGGMLFLWAREIGAEYVGR